MSTTITLDQLKKVGEGGVIQWGHSSTQGIAQKRREITSGFKRKTKLEDDLHGGYSEHTIQHFSSSAVNAIASGWN